jgi:hypothetical protein
MSFKPQHHRVLASKEITDLSYYYLSYNSTEFAKGNCVGIDTELFYPENNELTADQRVLFKRMCGDCPVKAMCLEWALCHEREGIWAGTSPHDRRRIRHAQRIGVADPSLASKHLI